MLKLHKSSTCSVARETWGGRWLWTGDVARLFFAELRYDPMLMNLGMLLLSFLDRGKQPVLEPISQSL